MKSLIIIFTILTYSLFSQEWKLYNENTSFLENGNQIYDIIVDYNNEVWLIHDFENVYRYKNNEWIKYDKENTGFNTFEFSDMELLDDNSILFGHKGQIENPDYLKFKDEKFSHYETTDGFFTYLRIKELLFINESDIWFLTDFGVFHKKDNEWKHYLDNQTQGKNLRSIHEINDYIFVFGRFGVCYKYIENSFERIDYDFPKNIDDEPYYSNNKDFIYVNTTNGQHLMKFDGSSWYEESYNLQDSVRSIYLTREDKVLALTRKSVYEYKDNTCEKLFDFPDSVIEFIDGYGIKLREIDYDNNYYLSNYSDIDLIIYYPNKTSVENKIETTKIYPNPTSNIINIETNVPTNIELFDIFGNKIYKDFNTKLDISNLTPGTYYIKFLGQTKMVVKI